MPPTASTSGRQGARALTVYPRAPPLRPSFLLPRLPGAPGRACACPVGLPCGVVCGRPCVVHGGGHERGVVCDGRGHVVAVCAQLGGLRALGAGTRVLGEHDHHVVIEVAHVEVELLRGERVQADRLPDGAEGFLCRSSQGLEGGVVLLAGGGAQAVDDVCDGAEGVHDGGVVEAVLPGVGGEFVLPGVCGGGEAARAGGGGGDLGPVPGDGGRQADEELVGGGGHGVLEAVEDVQEARKRVPARGQPTRVPLQAREPHVPVQPRVPCIYTRYVYTRYVYTPGTGC